MIWAAIFLLCGQANCITIGSPIFKTRDVCETAVRKYGLQAVAETYPSLRIVNYKCISFGDLET